MCYNQKKIRLSVIIFSNWFFRLARFSEIIMDFLSIDYVAVITNMNSENIY